MSGFCRGGAKAGKLAAGGSYPSEKGPAGLGAARGPRREGGARAESAAAGRPGGGTGRTGPGSRHLPALPRTGTDPHANRLWRGQSPCPARLLRRSARGRRRSSGRAVRGPGRPIAQQDHQRHGVAARGRVHSQHPQVATAGQPQPHAPGSRQLPRVPRPPVGDHPAGVHLLPWCRCRPKPLGYGQTDRQAAG